MRIKCRSLFLPEELVPRGLATLQGGWPVTLHAEYRVLALKQAEGLWHAIFEHRESEMPVSAPLALFDVIDPSVAPSWNVRIRGNEVALQPNELDDEYFCDDVQERRDDALERYRAMKARLDGT